MTYAKIIADSISPEGVRLTTMEVRFHRFVLAEFNTHRVFSRNSASSRAIPVRKQIERIQTDLAYPVSWPTEQKGMQGGPDLNPEQRLYARSAWATAFSGILAVVRDLTDGEVALHKSIANRLMEPFMWHTVVVTATAFENFFDLRLDSDAQPEIRVAAQAMWKAYQESTPTPLAVGEWHLPYISDEDRAQVGYQDPEHDDPSIQANAIMVLTSVSAARCGRVSYLTQDGKRDMDEDLGLYDRFITDRVEGGKPVHWSPLEHVATPWPENRQITGSVLTDNTLRFTSLEGEETKIPTDHLPKVGNLLGWRSLRTEVEALHGEKSYR